MIRSKLAAGRPKDFEVLDVLQRRLEALRATSPEDHRVAMTERAESRSAGLTPPPP
ncbi:MAG: hypothetical protein ACRD0L_01905 [Acidimicrobiales bacterium]